MGTENINGNSLCLRKYVQEDADKLYLLLGIDPDITKYTDWNPYASREMSKITVQRFIEGYEKNPDTYSWVIEADGMIVGTIGAFDYDEVNRSIEIGYSIGKEYWGKGYATEATCLAIYFLTQYENILTINSWCIEENIASAKVLEKAGFHCVGKEDVVLKNQSMVKLFYKLEMF